MNRNVCAALISLMMMLGVYGTAAAGDPATTNEAAQHPADNTGRNVRDKDGDTLTAMDQSNKKEDLELTQKIRQEVVADKDLSTMAHNVKIITRDGVVTLRGPVKSAAEKQRVAAKAVQVAGAGRVKDQLEIAQ